MTVKFSESQFAFRGPFDKAFARLATSTRQTPLSNPSGPGLPSITNPEPFPAPIENETPISQLPLAGWLQGDEEVPIVQYGITCRATSAGIAAAGALTIPGQGAYLYTEYLPITTLNVIPPLAYVPDLHTIIVYVNGQAFFANSMPPDFSVDGRTIVWNPSNPYSIVPGATVEACYTFGGGTIESIGIPDAPFDGTAYARKDEIWTHLTHNDITDWAATLAPYALTAGVPVASSTVPLMDSTGAVGVGVTWARADHVHPVDTSRYAASNPSGFQTSSQVSASIAAAPITANVTPTSSLTTGQLMMSDGAKVQPADTASVGTSLRFIAGGVGGNPGYFNKISTMSNSVDYEMVFDNYGGTFDFRGTDTTGTVFSACALRVFNVYTDYNDSEWGAFDWITTPNVLTIGSRANGTGVLRPVSIVGAGVALQGIATNTAALAGKVGEVIANNVASPGVTLATTVVSNVTSISLTAGDWDIGGELWVGVGAGGATLLQGGIGTTSATLGVSSVSGARAQAAATFTASQSNILCLKSFQLLLGATTTVYLVAAATFPSGTTTAWGNITARRRR